MDEMMYQVARDAPAQAKMVEALRSCEKYEAMANGVRDR